MTEKKTINFDNLKKEIPYQWKIQSVSGNQALCVSYIDARDVQELLDKEVGPENWQSDYKEIKGVMYGGLALKVDGEWVWKWDAGEESSFAKEKGEASDAFKRAAVKWGIGRFLYDMPKEYVNVSGSGRGAFPVDENGKRIYDLTKYIAERKKNPNATNRPASRPAAPSGNAGQYNNFVQLLKNKLYKLGATSEEQAIDMIINKTGIKPQSMNLTQAQAKSILDNWQD